MTCSAINWWYYAAVPSDRCSHAPTTPCWCCSPAAFVPGAMPYHPARHTLALASRGLPLVLEVDITAEARTFAAPGGDDRPDLGDGCQQSPLGCRAHPWRTPQ